MVKLGLLVLITISTLCSIPSLTRSDDVSIPASLNLNIHTDPESLDVAGHDFGNITIEAPSGVLCPSSTNDIATLVRYAYGDSSQDSPRFRIAARGNGHSLRGQAFAPGGIVVNMSCLAAAAQPPVSISDDGKYADVSGGMLWVELLKATLEKGLTPVSWTDYIYLSVGGTLSNAGISGQTFRHGPQISNVLELDVITGKGDLVTCSPQQNPDLFFAVLGGLGQFGIITRARVNLAPAPKNVKWSRILYSDFEAFKKDQLSLISKENDIGADYVEGVVYTANGFVDTIFFAKEERDRVTSLVKEKGIVYGIEVVKYYDDATFPEAEKFVKTLSETLKDYIPDNMFVHDTPYIEFLSRVRAEELRLKPLGLWDVPHPWFDVLIPESQISAFNELVIKGIILDQTLIPGYSIYYPTNRNTWDSRVSAVIPEEDVFYNLSVLLTATKVSPEDLMALNDKMIQYCEKNGIKFKKYLMGYENQKDWINHFESKWDGFQKNKNTFDPKRLLSPRQNIF